MAQQSGNGLSNLFGGIFSGPKSDAAQQPAVPGSPARSPGAARTAPPAIP